jgi:hypothetical protein
LSAWCFENGAPLLLLAFWYRRTRGRPGRVRALFNRIDVRSLYVAAGVLLHLGIWATLEVGEFLGYCLAYFACCFSPHEWQGGFSRLRGVLGRGARDKLTLNASNS